MAEITALNGAPLSSGKKINLRLEYELQTGKLALDGDLQNLDMAINVLQQATRWLEARYLLQQQMIVQAEMQRDRELLTAVRH